MSLSIDRNLLDAAARGHKASQAALLTLVRPHVERQLLRYPLNDADRSDLLQATSLQVIRRLSSFRGDSSFSTWLFRVAANEALMWMRSQRRRRVRVADDIAFDELAKVAGDDGAETPEARVIRLEREAFVRAAIAELPEEAQYLVRAHYHDDRGLEEIANELSTTESAVRSRLHRARVALRASMRELAQAA